MKDKSKKDNEEIIERASEQFAQIFVASIDEHTKPKSTEWNKEERDNIVGAFDWLLKQDKKQHPENYKKTEQNDTNTRI
jgi:hypothetical protein